MALKNWKKVHEISVSDDITWRKKGTKKQISIAYYRPERFWIFKTGNIKERKDFKNKKSALRFAKIYMRKH